MADPSIRLSNSGTGGSGSNLTIGITGTPSDGELIIFAASLNQDPPHSDPSDPSGFSLIASRNDGDFEVMYVWGKIASGEGTNPSYTAPFSGLGARSCGAVMVFQDANTSLPTNAATIHDTSASTSFTIPALTTTKNGSFDLAVVAHDGNFGTSANNYSSWGSSLSELFDFKDGGSGFSGIGIAGVTRASAGSQAATTVTSVRNDKNIAIRIEVEPAAGGGGGVTVKTLAAMGVG